MRQNQFEDDVNKRHLIAIACSPIMKPQVRGYLYQIAKTARMDLDRRLSANPRPIYPTQEMVDTQENYCYVLGEQLQVNDGFTSTLLNWIDEKLERTQADTEKLTEMLMEYIAK